MHCSSKKQKEDCLDRLIIYEFIGESIQLRLQNERPAQQAVEMTHEVVQLE